MTFAEIYEEKPFLISGEENVLVGDVGENNLLEKVKERKGGEVEVEGELEKTDLGVERGKGGLPFGIEGVDESVNVKREDVEKVSEKDIGEGGEERPNNGVEMDDQKNGGWSRVFLPHSHRL